jgi:hypothetical protein
LTFGSNMPINPTLNRRAGLDLDLSP